MRWRGAGIVIFTILGFALWLGAKTSNEGSLLVTLRNGGVQAPARPHAPSRSGAPDARRSSAARVASETDARRTRGAHAADGRWTRDEHDAGTTRVDARATGTDRAARHDAGAPPPDGADKGGAGHRHPSSDGQSGTGLKPGQFPGPTVEPGLVEGMQTLRRLADRNNCKCPAAPDRDCQCTRDGQRLYPIPPQTLEAFWRVQDLPFRPSEVVNNEQFMAMADVRCGCTDVVCRAFLICTSAVCPHPANDQLYDL